MLQLLKKEDYQLVSGNADLFKFPLIAAVIEKKQDGYIYIDSSTYPRVFFILHKAGFSHLYASTDIDYNKLIEFFINQKDIPVYFHLYEPPQQLIDCSSNKQFLGIKLRKRIQFRYNKASINTNAHKPSIAVTAKKIDKNNFDSLKIFELNIADKFWSSSDDFLKHGYGFFLVDRESEPVAICYSACVANNFAEVDILTRKEYQQSGLAKYATALFIEEGLKRGITANWDCFEENTGSLKTAEKIGFEEIKRYSFLSLYNNSKT